MGKSISVRQSAKNILAKEGPLAFYKGAGAVAVGTMLQRGFVMSSYELVYSRADQRLDGTVLGVQKRALIGGMFAGIVRSVLECPFEYVKVRRMTGQSWNYSKLYTGFSTLAPRSTLVLTSFFVQVDHL